MQTPRHFTGENAWEGNGGNEGSKELSDHKECLNDAIEAEGKEGSLGRERLRLQQHLQGSFSKVKVLKPKSLLYSIAGGGHWGKRLWEVLGTQWWLQRTAGGTISQLCYDLRRVTACLPPGSSSKTHMEPLPPISEYRLCNIVVVIDNSNNGDHDDIILSALLRFLESDSHGIHS